MAQATKTAEASVVDERDVSPRKASDTGGKRVKAIPFAGGNEIVVQSADFREKGHISHPDVRWHFLVDKFTVRVGVQISQEAADFLVKNYPNSFKYV